MKNWETGISARYKMNVRVRIFQFYRQKKFWSGRNSCNPKNLVFRIELNRASSDAEFDTDSKYHMFFLQINFLSSIDFRALIRVCSTCFTIFIWDSASSVESYTGTSFCTRTRTGSFSLNRDPNPTRIPLPGPGPDRYF